MVAANTSPPGTRISSSEYRLRLKMEGCVQRNRVDSCMLVFAPMGRDDECNSICPSRSSARLLLVGSASQLYRMCESRCDRGCLGAALGGGLSLFGGCLTPGNSIDLSTEKISWPRWFVSSHPTVTMVLCPSEVFLRCLMVKCCFSVSPG